VIVGNLACDMIWEEWKHETAFVSVGENSVRELLSISSAARIGTTRSPAENRPSHPIAMPRMMPDSSGV